MTHSNPSLTHTLLIAVLTAFACVGTAWTQQDSSRTASGRVSADYKIAPGDIIDLSSLNDPEGTGQLRVSQNGYANHRYMGPLKIAGLTESQAAKAFEKALRGDYLINPSIRVTVLSYAKLTFVVIGAVNNPGQFDEPANKKVTLIQAIARAGDFKDIANRKKVVVRRTVTGKVQAMRVNVKALLDNPNLPPFYLEDGDTVEVKESLF